MQDIQQRFEAAIDALRPGSTLVVGVSGGLDSMALLELLRSGERKVIVAHFNHQLRGAESDGDEAFVRKAAAKRRLQFRVGRGDVRAEAKGISIEMAARKLRHGFLAEVAREVGGDIVLAHHADDQIELVLMRARRRIEGYGAGGMRPVSPSPAEPTIRILRPLLDFEKADLEGFVKERKIAFREDSSNAQLDIERNRVRHQVLPMLREQFGPEFGSLLLKQAAEMRASDDWARQTARAWIDGEYDSLPDRLKMEIVVVQLHRRHLPVRRQTITSLLADRTKPVTIRPGQTATLDARGKLQVNDPLRFELPMVVALFGQAEQRVDFSGGALRWRFSMETNFDAAQNGMVFDAEKIGSFVMLRHPKPGDRVRLSGRASERPLMDVLNKNRVPREMRRQLVVASALPEGKIFWVEGLRITEDFKITERTKKTLEWKWTRGAP
jgi:tRNA(Ile)-lysidine synthase